MRKQRIIDSHYHIYDWFNSNGVPFWESANTYCLEESIDCLNVNALPSVERDVSNNIICALFKLHHPHCYAHGGLIYETYPVPPTVSHDMSPLTQYRELMEIGFDGIKMLETKPLELKVIGKTVDDPFYKDFFAEIANDGTHMIWHVNDPDVFWDINRISQDALNSGWFYGDGTYPTHQEIYEQVFRVLDENPNMNVTFAHFFFLSEKPEILEKVFAKYPNIAVDLTPGSEMYGAFGAKSDYYYDFFNRYSDKILFGTDSCDIDYPCWPNHVCFDTVYRYITTADTFDVWGYHLTGLNLPQTSADKILWQNFEKRVGNTPKEINKGALKAYIKKYRHLIKNPNVQQLIDASL